MAAALNEQLRPMRGTMVIIHSWEDVPSVRQFLRPIMLEELKAGIGGGYIELVPGFTSIGVAGVVMDCVAFCDEDGKRKELPINHQATEFWRVALERRGLRMPIADQLCGDIAIIFGDKEFMATL
jgi:hypothetical protein